MPPTELAYYTLFSRKEGLPRAHVPAGVQALMGILSDQHGRKGPIVLGLFLAGAAMGLFTQARSWSVMLVLW